MKRVKKILVNKYTYIAIGIVAALYVLYSVFVSSTEIAFINFRDFQVARISGFNDNPFIQVDCFTYRKSEKLPDLSGYDAVYVFGMGISFSPDQRKQIRDAIESGTKVFVNLATDKESDLTNVRGKDYEYISGYFKYKGKKNYRALLNYTRRIIDGKRLFADRISEPEKVPMDYFFYPGVEKYFKTYKEYLAFYKKNHYYKTGSPAVALVLSNVTPRNSSQKHVKSLIDSLHEQNINVFPVAGIVKRLEFLKDINPGLIVYFPHGKFTFGRGTEIRSFLSKNNIPVLAPLFVFENRNEWEKSQQGMFGALLTQSIVTPELDGCIQPYVISAQEKNSDGLNEFVPLEKRVRKFSRLVQKWLVLKTKKNSEKKIAVYYYKGPGLNSMVAAGMEVTPSLLNLLRSLKAAGYDTGPLPASVKEFEDIIQKKGKIIGPYAKGTFKNYLRDGDPALVRVDEYKEWLKKDLESDLVTEVEKLYGPPPGEYMAFEKDGRQYMAIVRVRFGNVVLLPQPLPALGDNEFQLIHGAKKAPPHPYIASYLWTRNRFKADAIMHFGTHGSLEFTPWKQVALSDRDWPDVLTGGFPHIYVYVINNVGEAIIAKRRSYAVITSHLTPPFDKSGLYGDIKRIRSKIDQYNLTRNTALKKAYAASIKKLVLNLKLDKVLEMKDFSHPTKELPPDSIDRIEKFISILENEKITRGLYTFGEPYSRNKCKETVLSMMIDPVAYSLAELDKAKKKITGSQMENPAWFNGRYRPRAYKIIQSILSDSTSPEIYLDRKDLERLDSWDNRNRKPSEKDMLNMFLSFTQGGTADKVKSSQDYEAGLSRAREIVIKVLPYKEKHDYLVKLKDEVTFRKATDLLDPQKRDKVKTLARLVPKMKKVLKTALDPDMIEIVKLMENEKIRKKIFDLIDDKNVQKEIIEEKARIKKLQVQKALQKEMTTDLFLAVRSADTLKTVVGAWSEKRTKEFIDHCNFYNENRELGPLLKESKTANAKTISNILETDSLVKQLKNGIETAQLHVSDLNRKEIKYIDAVRTLKDSLYKVRQHYVDLADSPQAELKAVATALDGGYIRPSSGGDAVYNPDALPTGRNLYAIDSEKTPTVEAYETGKAMAGELVSKYKRKTGRYPRKVAFTLWGGEFIRSQGVTLGEIFYLLGVEPVRNSRGDVHDVRLIPSGRLKRPRIDVVVQTSGQFRDVAASRIYLIDKAVNLAAKAEGETGDENYVREGVVEAERVMKEQGISPREARELSAVRIFGGVNGSYGTGIMGLVEQGDAWDKETEVSERYLKNMGAVYTKDRWGYYKPGIFKGALKRTDAVVQPSSSNMSGTLSLDHVYEFMGGLNLTVRNVTGKDPEGYINDLRNKHNPRVTGLKESVAVSSRATVLNPKYIKDLTKGGASSAEEFAETFRNIYGWNVMKPSVIDNELWDNLYKTYIKDQYNIGTVQFFKNKNPYALQEMTAVMLETVRKGYWKPSGKVVADIAKMHAELVRDHKAGCSGFVCNNQKLKELISRNIDSGLNKKYSKQIERARTGDGGDVKGMKLVKKDKSPVNLKKVIIENKGIAVLIVLVFFLAFLIIYGMKRKLKEGEE